MRKDLLAICCLVFAITTIRVPLAQDVFGTTLLARGETSDISYLEIPTLINFASNKELTSYLNTLNSLRPKLNYKLRGKIEIAVYKRASPSVVLLVNENSTGSGVVIQNGLIVTNYHVVGQEEIVGVVFKPMSNSQKLTEADVKIGKVIAINKRSDLALISIKTNIQPIPLNTKTPDVGADVHAIGHPSGQNWTYTRGFVSQVRPDFNWSTKTGGKHIADVIQTQTPINPGNSGGPLVDGNGKLIGINSFKKIGGEGLNYAVATKEVISILTAAKRNKYRSTLSAKTAATKCKMKVMFKGRNKNDDGDLRTADTNCDGEADLTVYKPDDVTRGTKIVLDRDFNGKPDAVIHDKDNDGLWDVSYYDNDGDGKTDLIGRHPDGKAKASSYEKYKRS
jgi:S1-C subfamily serine protease